MTPGYMTTEFWLTVAAKGLSLAVAIGVISANQEASLTTAFANAITGVFAIVSLCSLVKGYVQHRTSLKLQHAEMMDQQSDTVSHSSPALGKPIVPMLLAALLLGLFAGNAPAQWSPYRRAMEGRMRALEARSNQPAPAPLMQQAPAPQPIIIQQPTPAPAVQAPAPLPAPAPVPLPAAQATVAPPATVPTLDRATQAAQQAPIVLVIQQPSGPVPQVLAVTGPVPQILPISGPVPQVLPVAGPVPQTLPTAGPVPQVLPINGAPAQQLPGTQGAPAQQLAPAPTMPTMTTIPQGLIPPAGGVPSAGQVKPISPPGTVAPIPGAPAQQLPVGYAPQRYVIYVVAMPPRR